MEDGRSNFKYSVRYDSKQKYHIYAFPLLAWAAAQQIPMKLHKGLAYFQEEEHAVLFKLRFGL